MNFGEALKALEAGLRVTRKGWNGKGMWLVRITWSPYDDRFDLYNPQPFIAMKTADDKLVAWTASQTDLLADDWETTI